MVKYLLEKGMDPNLAASRWGRETNVLGLLAAGAGPNIKAVDGQHKGVSTAELAESLGEREMHKLLTRGAT